MASYGKFRPIKTRKHRKPKPRYISFRTGEQGWTFKKPSWDPTTKQLKALALVFIVITGILGADQVAKVLFPNSSLSPIAPYDPFTLLWNGTISSGISSGSGSGFNFANSQQCANVGSCVSGSFTVVSGQILIIAIYQAGSYCGGTISDSLGTTFTLQNCSSFAGIGGTCIGPNLSGYIFTGTTVSGSDTVTVTMAVPHFFAFSISDYSGITAFGTVKSNSGNAVSSLNVTLTGLSTQSEYEMTFGEKAVAPCDAATITEAPATQRLTFAQQANNGKQATGDDLAKLSGSVNFVDSYSASSNMVMMAMPLTIGTVPNPCLPAGYLCFNSGITGGKVQLTANSTTDSVVLTNSPIDVSTGSAKELFFFETWHNTTLLSTTSPWGWYLTTNATLPKTAAYSPLNDTNVVLANVVYPNAGATSKNYYEYMAKTGASQTLITGSGSGPNPYPSCPQTATLYICSGANTGASSSAFFAISTTLNYTGTAVNGGNNGFSLQCVDTTPTQGPPTSNFCSSASSPITLSPCTASSFCATTTLPFLNMQSGPFYLGFWSSAGQSATIQFGTVNTGAASQRANSIWYWVPNPTNQTPATPDTGSFFGPLIKALLGIGVWIVANIVSFITFLATVVGPFLAGTLSVLVAFVQAEMNALGQFIGWGNIGDQFISFAAGVLTYFTTGLGDALLWLARLILRSIDLIKIANSWVNFYLGGLLNFLADGLNVISFIVTLGNKIVTYLGTSYVFMLTIIFLWYDADMGIAGWHAWFETVKWLAFVSFDFLERMINFGISSVTWLFGRIPTLDGSTLPELPTIAIGGGPIWPSMEMTSLREGNVFALFGQIIGVTFLFWFETSGLPGSIGANVPGSPITNLAPFITLYLIIVGIMGLVFVVSIPATLMRRVFDLDRIAGSPNLMSNVRQGVISTGGVSGKLVRKHPERKFNIQVNRGLGVRGLRPHLRKPQKVTVQV